MLREVGKKKISQLTGFGDGEAIVLTEVGSVKGLGLRIDIFVFGKS